MKQLQTSESTHMTVVTQTVAYLMRQDEDVVTHRLGGSLSFLLLLFVILTRCVLRVKRLLGHIHLQTCFSGLFLPFPY